MRFDNAQTNKIYDPRKTFCMLKPDVVERRQQHLLMESMFRAGFVPIMIRLCVVREECVRALYAEHAGRDYYETLVSFILSGPVIPMVLIHQNGPDVNVVEALRANMGPSAIARRAPDEWRWIYGHPTLEHRNAIHGSDSPLSAEREIALAAKYIFP